MTKTELRELIEHGENSGVEFRRDEIDSRALAKELVAFANLQGGRVLLGVDEDGSIPGLTRSDPPAQLEDDDAGPRQYQKLEEWVMQACRDKIRPELVPHFEVVRDVEPGRDVAVVRIDRGWGVHHAWHNQHRIWYVRVGSTSREASPEERERLFQQRSAFRLELRPVSGTSIRDMDRRRLRDYFEQVREQEAPASIPSEEWRRGVEAWAKTQDERSWKALAEDREREWSEAREGEWTRLLVNTGFLDENDPHPATVAGLMLAGANPNRFLPQAGIDAAAYFGPEKDSDARERCKLRGPLVRLHGADGAVLEPGLPEQAVEFIRRNIETATLEDGIRRRERWDYPAEVVREAIINAIVHRDYLLSSSNIELGIYSDRLEVVSPGRLPNGITPERMRFGCRRARNQLLKDVMRDYAYIEATGLGVPRKIVHGMHEHNGTEPDLVEEEERFIVLLWKEPRA